ncbi:MAG: hypothetical protein PWQ28_165 [Candidatus Woesearchaeota archaeon]|nr:hypothetical protein [Candidatus Woesearchaeota archaeon]MDK2908160.1 hypothetical protein [Candidatus Woesearchaeota archaeon]
MVVTIIPKEKELDELFPEKIVSRLNALNKKYNIFIEHSKRNEPALSNEPYSFKRLLVCPLNEDPFEFIEKISARKESKGRLKGFSVIERDFHPIKASALIFNGDPQEYKVIEGNDMLQLVEKAIASLK